MNSKIKNLTEWDIRGEAKENQTLETNDSQKHSQSNTTDSIANKVSITEFMPHELSNHILKLDRIVQTGIDTLATTNLCVLAALSGGTHIFDREDDSAGTPIILYSAGFFKSGGGKTASVGVNREYFLDWQEKEFSDSQETIDKRRSQIEIELKSLGSSAQDRERRIHLEEELLSLKTQPDVYLEDATAEGFEASIACESKPFLFVDNFGKYLLASTKSEHKANMLRMMDNVFDSGKTTTRRLKGENKRAKQLSIDGFGAHFASTLGDSNLKPKDIKNNIENGFFNKVLVTFQDTMDKPIPLRSSLGKSDKKQIELFARKYHTMAQENHFYLDDDAYNVYASFHRRTSDEFIRRYNNDEDLAGLIIRLLKIAKRIACVFEIATECESYKALGVPIELEGDPLRAKVSISTLNMQRAINFIEYLKSEHISKIMLYAQSQNGKLSASEVVLNAITRLADSKTTKNIDYRSIIGRLSKNQRMSVAALKPILQQLINEGKISKRNEHSYFIPS